MLSWSLKRKPIEGSWVISRIKEKLKAGSYYWLGWKQQKAEKEDFDDMIEALARGEWCAILKPTHQWDPFLAQSLARTLAPPLYQIGGFHFPNIAAFRFLIYQWITGVNINVGKQRNDRYQNVFLLQRTAPLCWWGRAPNMPIISEINSPSQIAIFWKERTISLSAPSGYRTLDHEQFHILQILYADEVQVKLFYKICFIRLSNFPSHGFICDGK